MSTSAEYFRGNKQLPNTTAFKVCAEHQRGSGPAQLPARATANASPKRGIGWNYGFYHAYLYIAVRTGSQPDPESRRIKTSHFLQCDRQSFSGLPADEPRAPQRFTRHPPFLSHRPAATAPMAVEVTTSRADGAISGSHRFTSHISKAPNPSGNPEHLKPLAVNGVLPPQIIQKKINLILLLHPKFIPIERRGSQRLWRPLIAHYV